MSISYQKIFDIILLALAVVSFIGSLVYRFYNFKTWGILLALILSIIVFLIILYFARTFNKEDFFYTKKTTEKTKPGKLFIFLAILYFIFWASSLIILFQSGTQDSLSSPWQNVGFFFFLFYTLSSLTLLLLINIGRNFSLFFIMLHYFLSFSVAIIVYRFGFGYDFFIHQATMEHINRLGEILPKPFYYLGQYALLLMGHKLFFIPLEWSHKLLVPLLSAIYLPLYGLVALRKYFNNDNKIYIVLTCLLLLPFSLFTATTPQNLAFLLLVLIVLRGINCRNHFDLALLYALALAALSIHPLAGIPAIVLTLGITIYHSNLGKYKNHLYRLLYLLAAAALPLAFYLVQRNNAATGNNAGENISSAASYLPRFPNQENIILNIIYFFIFNYWYFLVLLLLAGILIVKKQKKICDIYKIYAYSALAFAASYLLIKNYSFSYLISYERNDFSFRVLIVVLILLFPYALTAIYAFIYKLWQKKLLLRSIFLLFFTMAISISLYAAYPRADNYHRSHFFSVSKSDIKAVEWIDNNASGNYIVLANQQVSAAALRQFGFRHYYNDVFYYPIPTSSPLYPFYLDMVYKEPSKKTMEQAMDMAGVNEAYFVLNKYWWAFSKIAREAELSALHTEKIDKGEIIVYKYAK